jgi:hypothetical protein|tara:strand:+ start:309 stop:689 length:381 start_codon:yes stop_codon:yes gene_type:complete
MRVRIIAIYKKEEEIKKIIDKIKNYSFKDFSRTYHFDFSILKKSTDENLLEETFPRFELIKTVELRENNKGQRHYSFNYELTDKTLVIISLALDKIPPLIINGMHKKVNYKRFEKSLRKNYSNKFV